MTTLRTAAQQALEALEKYRHMMFVEAGCRFGEGDAAITALRAALATGDNLSPTEPVEWLTGCPECGMDGGCDCRSGAWEQFHEHMAGPFYRAPPQRPAEPQEPVAWMDIADDGTRLSVRQWSEGNRNEVPLYTAPPQRKPLTPDQTMHLANEAAGQFWGDEAHLQRFRIAIEAAHGIMP